LRPPYPRPSRRALGPSRSARPSRVLLLRSNQSPFDVQPCRDAGGAEARPYKDSSLNPSIVIPRSARLSAKRCAATRSGFGTPMESTGLHKPENLRWPCTKYEQQVPRSAKSNSPPLGMTITCSGDLQVGAFRAYTATTKGARLKAAPTKLQRAQDISARYVFLYSTYRSAYPSIPF
jgi:hypothetical protein